MKEIFLSFFIMVTFKALAGDKVGNGGDVIVCPDQRTVVLDIFQGEEHWGFEAIRRFGTRAEIISETLQKFSKVDSFLAEKFLKRSLEIEKEISHLEENTSHRSNLVKLTKNKLVNISDEGVAELPHNCEIVQAATQIQTPFPGEVKFTFQETLWNSLEQDVQASLILHEVVYEHMIESGEVSSRSTRYFNAALHSERIDSVKAYFDLSNLFGYRNIAIQLDGRARFFGEKKICSVSRKRLHQTRDDYPEATSATVGRYKVITKEASHSEALKAFHRKYVSQGDCD